MTNQTEEKNTGCFSRGIRILVVLFIIGLISEAITGIFGGGSSIDPASISAATPVHNIEGLYDWWDHYGDGYDGVEKMNKALEGEIVKVRGEIDYVNDDEMFINFSEVHVAGLNSASGSAYFGSTDELNKVRVGQTYTIAGKFDHCKYYQSEIRTYGGERTFQFYVILQNSIVLE